jgi:hypothetical protein
MLIDAIAGMVLLVALATVFVRAHHLQSSAELRVQSQQRSLQDAEMVLTKLHASLQTPVPEIEGAKVTVTHLGKGAAGGEWIEVRVERDGRSASLVGLVGAGGAS